MGLCIVPLLHDWLVGYLQECSGVWVVTEEYGWPIGMFLQLCYFYVWLIDTSCHTIFKKCLFFHTQTNSVYIPATQQQEVTSLSVSCTNTFQTCLYLTVAQLKISHYCLCKHAPRNIRKRKPFLWIVRFYFPPPTAAHWCVYWCWEWFVVILNLAKYFLGVLN